MSSDVFLRVFFSVQFFFFSVQLHVIKRVYSEYAANMFQFIFSAFEQLCVSAELHAVGSVGDRLRDGRRPDSADNPTEQVSLPSPARRTARGLVSFFWSVYEVFFFEGL